MNNLQEKAGLRVQVDTHHCHLRPGESKRLHGDVDGLARQVEKFPLSDLHILVEYNNRSNDYSVTTTPSLDGAPLVASDHDLVMPAAFPRCLDSLSENVRAYKDRLGNVPERQRMEKGTVREVEPGSDPDRAALDSAVANGDYTAFRTAILGLDESLPPTHTT